MIVIRQYRIYRKDLQANPDILYLFGDNLTRKGTGGQAFEMRGEPNAFGIATKRSISHNYPDDYMFDGQEDVIDIIDKEFQALFQVLEISQYKAIILPLDGIGTGLARLPKYAPKLLVSIETKLKELETL